MERYKNVKKNKEIFNIVDGKSDKSEILNIFKEKYKTILDDPLSQTRPKKYDNILHNCKFYSRDINFAINKLNASIDFDLIHSQHLKNVNNTYKEFIASLFSAFVGHGYLPEKMLYREIRPLMKNKLNNKSEASNFRPRMVSSTMLKLFEYCLLPRMDRHIKLDQHQFGYIKNTDA